MDKIRCKLLIISKTKLIFTSENNLKLKLHSFWPFALIFCIYVASSQSSLAAPSIGCSYDKLAHFLVFGLLATSIIRIPFFFEKRWHGVFLTVLLVSFFGGLDEFRQFFTEGRSVEFNDWIADTCGALLASTLYLKWGLYRQILETGILITKFKGDLKKGV